MKDCKIEIKWAILFTLMMLLWMLLERVSGLHDVHIDKHPIFSNFVAIPAIAIYVFALLDKRKNYYHGVMNYKQGFICGLIISLILIPLSLFTQYITSTIISPDFFSNAIKHALDHNLMEEAKAKEYFNLKSYMMQVLIGTPLMGIVTTAIVAIFTRSKQ